MSSAMTSVVFGPPLDLLRPIWRQVRWYAHLAVRLWHWRAPANQDQLETWIARLEDFTPAELLALERVVLTVRSPYWDEAAERVEACAHTPKFHQPEQWVEYGRAIKKDMGQAQNVFRHVRVVHELRAAHPELPNPDAHLLAELAYQAQALRGRPNRRVSAHAHI